MTWPTFVLYSKPGCHLCEDLEANLRHLPEISSRLEVRDIRTRDDWHERYLFTIPVLCWQEGDSEHPFPPFPPRAEADVIYARILTHLATVRPNLNQPQPRH